MASAVAKTKGKRKEEKNKSLKDVEQAMNKINFGDNVSGENTSEGMVDTYFSYMAKMISSLPEGVRKQRLMMQLDPSASTMTVTASIFPMALMFLEPIGHIDTSSSFQSLADEFCPQTENF